MATLNQFQQYSQGENTVTNNVLLMLSSLYEINPKYYEEFIRGITEDTKQYVAIPTFLQQVNNKGNGFIDGYIRIKASKIIIETKTKNLENIDKLLKYTNSFEANEYKLLFHLSSKKYSSNQVEEIQNRLKEIKNGEIQFYSLTFQDLVDQLKELAKSYSHEHYLLRLNEHFEAYCLNAKLLPKSNHILRAMACGQSFELNIKHGFYFDLASRGYSDFNYLGIYKQKSVRHIGKIENVIKCDLISENELEITEFRFKVTDEQKERLLIAIKESINNGWDLASDHRFFLLKDLQETNFKKVSPGGIFRVRFFNLEEYLKPMPKGIKHIADSLRNHQWE